tara:strand:+ start:5144 stop:5917 length:774 start_codon:yes stop_codon:yes gene_type:complete
MSKKISKIKKSKSKKKLVCLTAYSRPLSKILDRHCDIVLVGDSVATAFYGMKDTKKIDIQTMINHAKSVKKSLKRSLMVFDMPHNTYRNIKEAKVNVKKVIKNVNCDAVKIESNGKNYNIIQSIVKSGVPVMGHIGYTPQFKKKFKVEGSKFKEEIKLLSQAKMIERAGAFSLVLECITKRASKKITNSIKIPTIGIGSSNFCDGQILVTDDLLGLSGFYPRFVKKYVNLESIIEKAIRKFKKDVKNKKFPRNNNSY